MERYDDTVSVNGEASSTVPYSVDRNDARDRDTTGGWQRKTPLARLHLGGPDTFVGGSGTDTMVGGTNTNLFEFVASEAGGQHVITNFVPGSDQLYLEGQTLSSLQSAHDITESGGNTYISLDGGKTSIELKGFTGLSDSDVTTHKT